MPRFLLLLRTLLALCAIGLVACPTNPGGDDDDAGDDDDDDDDDGASDPCDSVTDATANVNGATLTGNTSGPDDALTGSCGAGSPGAPETIFSIVAPEDGPMIASTANAGTDFDTIVYVMTTCGDDSTEVACDDDGGGQGGPSMAQWDATAGTTYYIVVDGYESSGNFELSIQQVICGDGVVAGDEQCDDSNTDSGDGCDSSCAWECTDDAYEPNSTLDEASDLSGETWPGTVDDLVLCPGDINDEFGVFVDFYAVTVGEGQYLDVEIQGGATLTTDCADQLMILSLLDADLNGLGGGDTSEGTCAQAAMEPEEAGTYYIAVFEGDQTFGPQDYTLSVDVGVSVCGDGNRTGIEECDDGNTTAGDGCSALCNEEDATCTIAGDATASVDGTNLTGDTSTAADEHAPMGCGAADGAFDVAYELTMPEDGPVIISLDNAGTDYDTVLYVREACLDPLSEIACNDDTSQEVLASTLFIDAIKDVTYTIVIDGYADATGNYEMSLTVPTCGDSTVDINEECDDGNTTPGDGCENDCTETPLCFFDADDDLGVLATGSTTTHSVTVGTSNDYPDLTCSAPEGGDHMVQFEVTAGGTLTVDFTQTGDVQVGIFADDADCDEAACLDAGKGATEGSLEVAVTPGVYRLVLDTYEAGGEGDVELSITVP